MVDSQNCFAIRWSIRNFLMCTEKPGTMLQSPLCKENRDRTRGWIMGVYPRGSDKENSVSVELLSKQFECDSFHLTVSIIGKDGTSHYSKEISTTPKNVTLCVRISKFIKRSDLMYQRESLLPFGTLTLQCVIRTPFKLVESCQDIKSNTTSLIWDIKNFCDPSGFRLELSDPIAFSDLKKAPECVLRFMVVKLSPGESEVIIATKKRSCYNARFLNYYGWNPKAPDDFSSETYNDGPLCVSIQIFALGDGAKRTFFVEGSHVFQSSNEDEIFSLEPVRVNESSYRECGFLTDNALSLLVVLNFSDGSLSKESVTKSGYFNPEPKAGLLENPWERISRDMFSDVVLKVGDESLPAHRAVLASQSEVFSAMFGTDMIEKSTGTVNIVDIDSDTMKLLLKLFYTGKVDNRLSCEDLLKLYVAVDKYRLQVETVRSVLISKITVANVWEVLRIAKRYNDDVLRSASKAFISANTSKSLDMLMSDDFQALPSSIATNPEIDISICDGQPFKKRRM